MRKLFALLFYVLISICANANTVGTWTAYPAYYEIKDVQKAGSMYFVLASGGLYSYDTSDQSVRTYDKTTVLNGSLITNILWNSSAQRLIIIYDDYNIDLLDKSGNIINIPDYYNVATTLDKKVNSVVNSGKYAYISTGFGVLKLNVANGEISETYDIGINVDWVHTDNTRIYAESQTSGCFSALLTANLINKNSWNRTADYTPYNYKVDTAYVSKVKKVIPAGPKYNNFGFIRFFNGKLYTCGGGFGGYGGLNELNRPGTVQVFDGSKWQIYQDHLDTITRHTFVDMLSVAVDPKNNEHVFAGGRTGLYEFMNGTFVKEYNWDNSVLNSSYAVPNSKDYCLVSSLMYDESGNLWICNSQSPTSNLLKMSSDGTWTNYKKTELTVSDNNAWYNMFAMSEDSRNLIWISDNHYACPALACYQPSTDGIYTYRSFVNEDGLTVNVSNAVTCVAEDIDKSIWVGTSAGPLLLKKNQIGNADVTFTQVKIPRNDGTNLADYLLNGVPITCMAVDAAGRKWLGTNDAGIYVISADNITQENHFQAANSSLLSDKIESLAIDNKKGLVYVGTDKGLCSYQSDATSTSDKMTKDNVYAYPNPVRPDYTGLVTVVGLTYDADVKIVTSNGVLVAEGRSVGGSFTWDCTDKQGKRVASGVYMVQTATSTGGKGTVCKIAVVN